MLTFPELDRRHALQTEIRSDLFLVDLVKILIDRLSTGKILVSDKNAADVLLKICAASERGFINVSSARSDVSIWESCISVAFSERYLRGAAAMIRHRNQYYVSVSVGGSDVSFYFASASESGIDISRQLAKDTEAHFEKSQWDDEAFKNHGREKIIAIYSSRVHDGLYAIASASMLASVMPNALLCYPKLHKLLNPENIPSLQHMRRLEVDWSEADSKRNCMLTSWIESPSFEPLDVYDHIESVLVDIYSNQKEFRHDSSSEEGITILISYEAEKRAWIEQVEGFKSLFKRLVLEFSNVTVYVNGMTAPDEGAGLDFFDEIRVAEENFIADLQRTVPEVKFFHLFGFRMIEKIAQMHKVDYFVGPAISAVMVPALLGKPGFTYAGTRILKQHQPFFARLKSLKVVSIDQVSDASEYLGLVRYDWAVGASDGTSYHIDPNYFEEAVFSDIQLKLGRS